MGSWKDVVFLGPSESGPQTNKLAIPLLIVSATGVDIFTLG